MNLKERFLLNAIVAQTLLYGAILIKMSIFPFRIAEKLILSFKANWLRSISVDESGELDGIETIGTYAPTNAFVLSLRLTRLERMFEFLPVKYLRL